MTYKSFTDYLKEDAPKEVTFVFGRFNPPTNGHEKVFDTLKKKAGKGVYRIYASQSNDPKKNPLKFKDKVKFLRKMFPKYARNIMADSNIRTVFDIVTRLYDQGFTKVNMVVGDDRRMEFDKLLNKYNGVDGRHGFYNFEGGITVISAGARDPDSDDVTGMSASKLRQAAADNNLAAFSKGMPSSYAKNAKDLFNAVRKGMGLKESYNHRKHIQLKPISEQREDYVKGDIFNPGDLVSVKETGEIGMISSQGANFVVVDIEEGQKKFWLDSIELVTEIKLLQDIGFDKIDQYLDRTIKKPIYKKAVRYYLDQRKKTSGQKDNGHKVMVKTAKVVNVDYRNLSKVFHDMIKKGLLPKHLAFESPEPKFKDYVK